MGGGCTLTNSSRNDEGTFDHTVGSYTDDRGALCELVWRNMELRRAHTEARNVCANMMTGGVVSIGVGALRGGSGIEI